MIIIYISQRVEAIKKPRQIINYDAGIVLIDLQFQLNVKQLQTIQISDTEYGANSSCQRRTEPAEQQPATSAFLTKWLNKLTSPLSKKGPGISHTCHWSLPSETNVRKEKAYTSIKKWWRMNIPRSSLRTGRYCKLLNYEGIAVIELQFYQFSWQWQTACWLCHRHLNSLND